MNTIIITVRKYDPQNYLIIIPFSGLRQILVRKIHDKLIKIAVQAKARTITYLCWSQYRQQQRKIEEKETYPIKEEMFLPCAFEIKFWEERRGNIEEEMFLSHTLEKNWGRV